MRAGSEHLPFGDVPTRRGAEAAARLPLRAWAPVLLMAGILIAILSASIQSAGWVGNSLPLLVGLAAGLLAGMALGWTRWGWRAALTYHIILCGLTLILIVGRVLPFDHWNISPAGMYRPAGELGADFLWLMGARLNGLLERLGTWPGIFFSGGVVQDPDAFSLLVGGMLWTAGAWLGWCLVRRGRALPGLLPLGFLLALNIYLNQEAATTMLGFLCVSLALVALTDWLREQQRWMRQGLDYSEELALGFGINAALLTLLIAALMWAASLLGTPQGWEALANLLRRAEQEVGEPAGRIFAGASTPEALEGSVEVKRPDLANIGEPINRDQGVVMWVNTSDPPPLPPEAGMVGEEVAPGHYTPQGHYWRSAIYAAYDGRGWEPAPSGGEVESGAEAAAQAPAGRYRLTQTFRIVAKHDTALFAVGEPVASPPQGRLRAVAGGSRLLEGDLSNYQVVSWATRVSAGQLQAAGTGYPAEVVEIYLQLPEGLPQRVRDLAARITRGAATPYEKALFIESYLRTNYQYDPYVSVPPQGRDAVDYFLFDAPGGFCTYYASAMAVLLRAEGVPARVASGYLMGEYDRMESAYRVPGSASHTWVEVYFPPYGWVEFEPTGAFPRIVYPGEAEAVPPKSPAERAPALDELPGLKAALWTAGILAGLAVLWMALRRLGVPGPLVLWARWSASRAAGPLSRGLYAGMRRGMAACGVPSQPGDTPYEFLARVEGETQDKLPLRYIASLQNAVRQVTEVYVQAQYSPRPPEQEAVRAARQAWRKTWWRRRFGRIAHSG